MKVYNYKIDLLSFDIIFTKYKLLLISTEMGDKAITAERIEEEAKKLGYEYYITKMEGTFIRKSEEGVWTVHKEDDEKGFIVSPSDTVCFIRGTPERDSYLDLVSQLERAGICVVNSRECMELASDKYRTIATNKLLKLQENYNKIDHFHRIILNNR